MAPGTLLPIVISVPHGGTKVPREYRSLCRLSLPVILRDNDTWARELFSVRNQVNFYTESLVARAVLDVNRDPRDRPPQYPDGVVKTVTVFGEQVWERPEGLSPRQADKLIAKYHSPYHERLRRGAEMGKVRLGVDCHTMLAVAPPGSSRVGEMRPLICLSNKGGEDGESEEEPLTAPALLIQALRDALTRQFQEEIALFPARPFPAVAINSPFKGGHIVQRQAAAGPIPWIMVEFNRSLYLPPHLPLTARPAPLTRNKLGRIRQKFMKALADIL